MNKKHLYRGESDSVGFCKSVCNRDIPTRFIRERIRSVTCKNCIRIDLAYSEREGNYEVKN